MSIVGKLNSHSFHCVICSPHPVVRFRAQCNPRRRVPLGFICGYPLDQGELYGGSMFARSAAPDTLQGKAICHVNRHWGEDVLQRAGRESLAVPVCKKKYTPFVFPIVKRTVVGGGGGGGGGNSSAPDGRDRTVYEVQVVRMYGCKCHHEHRKRVIERYGERKGWEPFGQWSMKKAVELARKESQRLNREAQSATTALPISTTCRPPPPAALLATAPSSSRAGELSSTASSDYDDDDDEEEEGDSGSDSEVSVRGAGVARNMCLSGKCLWKVKTAYDDVFLELTGQTESEAEDNGSAMA
jgi:hypothetical protein